MSVPHRNVCIILRGVLTCQTYVHRSGRTFSQDCISNMENVFDNIVFPLLQAGFDCDVMFACPIYDGVESTTSAVERAGRLLKDLDLVECATSSSACTRGHMSLLPVVDMTNASRDQLGTLSCASQVLLESKSNYEFVIISRCDVAFHVPISSATLDIAAGHNNVNIPWLAYLFRERHLSLDNLICDVFFALPGAHLPMFLEVLRAHKKTPNELHSLKITSAVISAAKDVPQFAFVPIDANAYHDSNTDNEVNAFYTILRGPGPGNAFSKKKKFFMPTSLSKFVSRQGLKNIIT